MLKYSLSFLLVYEIFHHFEVEKLLLTIFVIEIFEVNIHASFQYFLFCITTKSITMKDDSFVELQFGLSTLIAKAISIEDKQIGIGFQFLVVLTNEFGIVNRVTTLRMKFYKFING